MMLRNKSNSLQPGLIWMPYIPAQKISTFNSDNFNNKLGLKSRYSVKKVNPNFYGYIRTTNLIRKMKIENIFKIKKPN